MLPVFDKPEKYRTVNGWPRRMKWEGLYKNGFPKKQRREGLGGIVMTITEVSKTYEISADTIRYYERIGLLPPVNRSAGGIRDFTEENCNWVHFIKCMRAAGISIEVLIEYVHMFQQGDNTLAARRALLVEERAKLAAKMQEMQEALDRLDYKINSYEEGLAKCEEKLQRT